MSKPVEGKQIKKNVIISIIVQTLSLSVGSVLNLILPKFISETQYANWQTYVLYVGYVGILHFGLLDGIVLRYSQYDYDELDKPRIRSQFKILLFITAILSLLSVGIVLLVSDGVDKYIFVYVALGIITKNLFTYTSYTFQITNRISKYAILTISQKLFYGISTILLLCNSVGDFHLYCIADLCGDIFACSIGYCYNRSLYFGKSISLSEAIREFWINISSGIKLMVATWSSMLLLGSSKMLVQWHCDKILFAKYSFAFSMSSLFLSFVAAVSVVFFPSLKRMDRNRMPQVYNEVRGVLSMVLFVAMLLYFPFKVLLSMWLPQYNDSLVFLGIMLPIVVYTSKVTLLTNNYLKAYRKEQTMLQINVLSVIISFLLFVIAIYVFDSVILLLVLVVVAAMLRSILSEIAVMKLIDMTFYYDFLIEAVMTIGFMVTASCFPLMKGFIIFTILMGVYLFLCRKSFIQLKSYFI